MTLIVLLSSPPSSAILSLETFSFDSDEETLPDASSDGFLFKGSKIRHGATGENRTVPLKLIFRAFLQCDAARASLSSLKFSDHSRHREHIILDAISDRATSDKITLLICPISRPRVSEVPPSIRHTDNMALAAALVS